MIRSRSSIIAMAGAVLVGAILIGASPAAAQAPCAQWDVSGVWSAHQTNATAEIRVQQQMGTEFRGEATIPGEVSLGPLDGMVEGDRISFTVYWNARSVGVYSGTISPAGRIEGTTRDTVSGATADWFSNRRMNCLAREVAAQPPPPAKKIDPNAPDVLKEDGGIADVFKTSPVPDPAPPPAQNTATVNGDVDLYDAPGGEGNVIGLLQKGQKVTLAGPGCHADTWCRIIEGFVWGAFLTL